MFTDTIPYILLLFIMPCCRTDGKGNAELLMWASTKGRPLK